MDVGTWQMTANEIDELTSVIALLLAVLPPRIRRRAIQRALMMTMTVPKAGDRGGEDPAGEGGPCGSHGPIN